MRYICLFTTGAEWLKFHECASAAQAWAAAMDMRINHGHTIKIRKQKAR